VRSSSPSRGSRARRDGAAWLRGTARWVHHITAASTASPCSLACQFESQNDECTVSGTFRFLYLVQSAVPGIISDLTGNYFWPPPQTLLEPCTAAQIAAYTQQLGESSAAAEELVVGGQSRPEPR
jgi:hypothetical protein